MKRYSISLPDEVADRLERLATAERRSVAATGGLLLERALGGEVERAAPVATPPVEKRAPLRRDVPVGGQDAASGAGAERRRDELAVDSACSHPLSKRLGSRCQECGRRIGPAGVIGS